jgi:hypothetical protein
MELGLPPPAGGVAGAAATIHVTSGMPVQDVRDAFARVIRLPPASVALVIHDDAPPAVRARGVAGGRSFGDSVTLYDVDATCGGAALYAFPPLVIVSLAVSDDEYADAYERLSQVCGAACVC